jgi:hypothetical protein
LLENKLSLLTSNLRIVLPLAEFCGEWRQCHKEEAAMLLKFDPQSPRLTELERRKRQVEEKIDREKRRLRDRSKVRATIRARVLGESLMRVQRGGLINDELMAKIREDLLAHVLGRDDEFEALLGTSFDLSDR